MSSGSRDMVSDFAGTVLDAHPGKLPDGAFQEDKGGDRSKRGMWVRRRGMRHTDVAKQSDAITSIIGFEIPGGDFGLALVAGTNAVGETNVTQQADTDDESGFGAGGFGGGGFGE